MSGLDFTLDPERQPRRFEVINGAGGRRQWSVDDKARIIAETLEPNAIISEVARRYGLRPQQVFAWRREARKQAASVQQDSPAFVPAVVAAPQPVARRPSKQRKRKATRDAGVIELEIDGIAMRVGRGADAKTVTAVIRALKATT
ncbi:IS66-like element accessory protein TnpA [Mesorhizobium temperatum]|uniref:IS66-like element accessory protein TnpA n=1 Tax=Mesorhizobium temperatum TaxID=241416 RepID=UPI00142E5D43|nr:transposase [Mesorhizobium temperatum]